MLKKIKFNIKKKQFRVVDSINFVILLSEISNSLKHLKNCNIIVLISYSFKCEKWNRLFFTKKQKINFLKRSLSKLKVFKLFKFKKIKLYFCYF